MAPEVLQSKPYDFKADIWSLGVMFFELLTGNYPFQGQTKGEIFHKIRGGKYYLN